MQLVHCHEYLAARTHDPDDNEQKDSVLPVEDSLREVSFCQDLGGRTLEGINAVAMARGDTDAVICPLIRGGRCCQNISAVPRATAVPAHSSEGRAPRVRGLIRGGCCKETVGPVHRVTALSVHFAEETVREAFALDARHFGWHSKEAKT